MSVPTATEAPPTTEVAPTTEDRALRWAGRAGWAVLGVQLALMVVLSVLERLGSDLTVDDGTYFQAWWLISHGHLRAYSTFGGIPYVKINGELLLYPLALLFRPVMSQTFVLVFQDVALVGAAAVGFVWLLKAVRRPSWPARLPPWLAVTAYVVLMALNPWLYQTIAWPWHMEPLDALLLMLAAYMVAHRHWKRAAVFVVLCMLTGAFGSVMLAGLGLTTVLAGRRWRWPGVLIIVVGVAMVLVLTSLHLTATAAEFAQVGSSNGPAATNTSPVAVQMLRGIASHPERPISTLWADRLNLYANLGPTGIIGILTPWGFGVPAASLALSGLAANPNLRLPSFQNAAVYPFVALGTVLFIGWLARRRIPRAVPLAVTGLVTANAVLWAVVWLPQIPGEWLKVSAPAAAVLRSAEATIPADAEVVASTGVVGSFADRQWVYPFAAHRTYPVHESSVYLVVAPNQGIESEYVSDTLATMAYVADGLHAQLVKQGGGIWVFRWTPPAGARSFRLGSESPIPAWAAPGPAGTEVTSGLPANWYVAASGAEGYVVAGDYWRRGTGRYRVDVALSANVAVNVEVWNQSTNTLLARRSLTTTGLQDVTIPVDVGRIVPAKAPAGSGPFKIRPVSPRPGNAIEIRVWTGGGGGVSVYRVGLRRV